MEENSVNKKELNKNIVIRTKLENVYKIYIAKLFRGSSVHLSELELNILNSVRNNVYKWDSLKIAKILNISLPQVNNYKGKLKRKKLIIKLDSGEYIMNPDLEFPINKNIDRYNIQFTIIIEDESTRGINTTKETSEKITHSQIPADTSEVAS